MQAWWEYLAQLEVAWLRYGIALLVLGAGYVAKKIFTGAIARRLAKLTEKTTSKYDDLFLQLVIAPAGVFCIVVAVYLALLICQLPPAISVHLNGGFVTTISVLVLWLLLRLADLLVMLVSDKLRGMHDDVAMQFLPLLRRGLRVFLLVTGGIFIIQNVGVDVGSLLAGLGIGGLAMALAAQESLANFFGSLVLLVDRPFKIGDWVTVGDVDGDIEEMGFRSTRIRTWHKSLVTLPNKALSSANIENWSKMNKRRVKQKLHITYDTPVEKVQQFVQGIETILRNNKSVDQDYMLVKFTEFQESALEILVYYFTSTTVWLEYLEIKESNNYAFMNLAANVGVNFAFPTRTIEIKSAQ